MTADNQQIEGVWLDHVLNCDCMELLRGLPDACVDCVLTDPPYGTTGLQWDKVVTTHEWWREVRRVAKRNAAVLMFGQEPFSSRMRLASPIPFRYDWVWHKTAACGFLNANKMPLRAHEVVSVFYSALPTYNPQKTPRKKSIVRDKQLRKADGVYRSFRGNGTREYTDSFPVDVITMPPEKHTYAAGRLHPTQKPLDLVEYFVRTYTDAGQVVLDPFMGSGTTAVAAMRLGRHFVGSELDAAYHATIGRRLGAERRRLSEMLFRPADVEQ